MKVLVIPSWYPYPAIPHAGKFMLEQARALAEQQVADVNILNWGQNRFQLKLRNPAISIGKLLDYYFTKPGSRHLTNNLTEMFLPHISWTSMLNKGNIDALLRRITLDDKPDIIHAHVSFPAGYLAWMLSKKYGIPYVITEHSGPFPFPEYVTKQGISPLIDEPLKAANKVLAVSGFLQSELFQKAGIHAEVIPNLVNTSFYCPLPTKSTNPKLRIFTLSALTEAKGAIDLIKAVIQLKATGLDFCLYWGGSGNLKRYLYKYVMQQQLEKHVVFLGQINQEEALYQYRNCDCFVMPSHIESFSVVLIEALACGKPIIATDCGGPRDIVKEFCGHLVPVANPKQLVNALENLNEHLANYSSQQIRDYCVSHYSPSSVCEQIKAIYLQVLS